MNTDEIMFNVFGKLEHTTANIYHKPLNECIEYIEIINPHHNMIFCQYCIEEQVKKIAEYYKMKYVATEYLPKETLIMIVDKKIFELNYKKMIKELDWLEGENE